MGSVLAWRIWLAGLFRACWRPCVSIVSLLADFVGPRGVGRWSGVAWRGLVEDGGPVGWLAGGWVVENVRGGVGKERKLVLCAALRGLGLGEGGASD